MFSTCFEVSRLRESNWRENIDLFVFSSQKKCTRTPRAKLLLLAGLFLLTQGRFLHGLRSSMRSCVPLLQTGLLLLLLAYACYQLWA